MREYERGNGSAMYINLVYKCSKYTCTKMQYTNVVYKCSIQISPAASRSRVRCVTLDSKLNISISFIFNQRKKVRRQQGITPTVP